MGRKYGFSFSAKRAFGVSAAKGRIARATGIPTTRSGRRRKAGKAVGCCAPLALLATTVIATATMLTPPIPNAAPVATPAAAAPAASRDYLIGIYGGSIGLTELVELGRRTTSLKPYCNVLVQVENHSATKLRVYKTWRGDLMELKVSPAVLTDNLGNVYRRITFGLGTMPFGGVGDVSIYPGETIRDVLVFERPVDAATKFTLKLPREALGDTGSLEFELVRQGDTLLPAPPPSPPPLPPAPPLSFASTSTYSIGDRIKVGDAIVQVEAVTVGRIPTTNGDAERPLRERAMLIQVKIAHGGASGAGSIPFTCPVWNEDTVPPDTHPRLTNADGSKSYRGRRIAPPWKPAGTACADAAINQHGSRTLSLVFEPTAAAATQGPLRLLLPLTCIGETGTLTVKISQDDIQPVQ